MGATLTLIAADGDAMGARHTTEPRRLDEAAGAPVGDNCRTGQHVTEESPAMIKRNESALGVDLSDKTAHYCLMTTADGILAEGRIKLDMTKVAELWRELGQYADVVVMEAGTPAAWVRKLLESLGSRVIVADPRKLQAVTAAVRKSDVRDAQMLARL